MSKKTSNRDLTTIEATVLYTSQNGKSVYVENNNNIKAWLPKSQIKIFADSGKIELPYWLLFDKNLYTPK